MTTKNIGSKKLLKIGATALLSIGILGACQSEEPDDLDVDVNNPPEENIIPDNDTGTEPDVDVDNDMGEEPDVDVDVDDNSDDATTEDTGE